MIAILYEILGLGCFVFANISFFTDKNGHEWVFYLLCSIVLYLSSIKYDERKW